MKLLIVVAHFVVVGVFIVQAGNDRVGGCPAHYRPRQHWILRDENTVHVHPAKNAARQSHARGGA